MDDVAVQVRAMLGLPRDGSGALEHADPAAAAELGAGSAVRFEPARSSVVATVYLFDSYDEAMAALKASVRSDADRSAGTVNGSYLASVSWPAGDEDARDAALEMLSTFAGEE